MIYMYQKPKYWHDWKALSFLYMDLIKMSTLYVFISVYIMFIVLQKGECHNLFYVYKWFP